MLHVDVARLTCLLDRIILSFLFSSSSKSHRRFLRKSTCQLPIFTFVMFYSPQKFPKAWAGRWTLRMMQSYKKSRNNCHAWYILFSCFYPWLHAWIYKLSGMNCGGTWYFRLMLLYWIGIKEWILKVLIVQTFWEDWIGKEKRVSSRWDGQSNHELH